MTEQAAPLSHAPGGATSDLSYNAKIQPRYPQISIQQKEQGTEVLKVLVDAQGIVKAVDYEPKACTTTSASLISAASATAFKWHFNPAMKNGKPIESYARVPVKFSLTPLADKPASSTPSSATKKNLTHPYS